MVYSLRSIRPSSVAPVLGVLYFLAGCVSIAVLLVGSAFAPGPVTTSRLGVFTFSGMPPTALMIAWPFIAGMFGAVIGVIAAWLYNRIAGLVGPVKVELESAAGGV